MFLDWVYIPVRNWVKNNKKKSEKKKYGLSIKPTSHSPGYTFYALQAGADWPYNEAIGPPHHHALIFSLGQHDLWKISVWTGAIFWGPLKKKSDQNLGSQSTPDYRDIQNPKLSSPDCCKHSVMYSILCNSDYIPYNLNVNML
jgi:hypothetical protein